MAETNTTPLTIGLTPTWTEAARIICAVMENGTPEGKAMARDQIMHMGAIIDDLNHGAELVRKAVAQ
tara:strand:- start:29081 stop:29281 length:201 start_codon:yes stop_codon:yes gene_type:complete